MILSMRSLRSGAQDDLLLIVRRVEALGKFLDTEDGRICSPVPSAQPTSSHRGEEGRARICRRARCSRSISGAEERALVAGDRYGEGGGGRSRGQEDFEAAMRAMAKLRPHVDAFFDKVTVNVDDKELRENRLKLLNEIREATRAVADFSRIEG